MDYKKLVEKGKAMKDYLKKGSDEQNKFNKILGMVERAGEKSKSLPRFTEYVELFDEDKAKFTKKMQELAKADKEKAKRITGIFNDNFAVYLLERGISYCNYLVIKLTTISKHNGTHV